MADGHKWLLGPQGCGVLSVRESCLDLLRPLEPGWNSVSHREEWDNLEYAPDGTARRLEGGMPNIAGILGLGASIDLLLSAGVDEIWSAPTSTGRRRRCWRNGSSRGGSRFRRAEGDRALISA
ncbi:hypothetical protein SD37_08070 [Amycolatopsis orientalis]|uniref:Aminotransferase class V domain-containing protein n=1 Tax=Amycolatopsis orientalis TaxID=31958 RepID=A0A193BTV5_AMYOR|nr:hypothetical protein SD37_08070 [Amycolatopsis orientalis]